MARETDLSSDEMTSRFKSLSSHQKKYSKHIDKDDLVQPQPFGLYTLINRINVGGMAEVFKACYYDQGRPAFAAIKRILPHLAQDQSFINMFISEAHTAGRLIHSNIAQIIEQGEEEGEYFISMEYVSGRDLLYLRHHLRERGMYFPPALAAHAIQSVASALDYAHRLCDEEGQHLEIIHRDISPQNILISYEGEVKLIDFGIAKAKTRTHEHTRAGVLKGKFGYMSPEQVKGKPIDHRTDIFALGTVFYELLTNQRLFMGESDIETLELVRSAQISPPSRSNEWVPPFLDQVVMKALQPDPDQRFQNAGELAQALAYFIQNEAPMTHQSTLKSWMNKEFSTFIAHEKAQDAYLIEQMLENLEDSSEDLDSTSLISSEVIEQLNQYTGEMLNGELDVHTAPQEINERWSADYLRDTNSIPANFADQETSPPHGQYDGLEEGAPNELKPTIPISEEVLLSLHHSPDEMREEVFNSLQTSSPFASTELSLQTQKDFLDQDELEELLEESFDDSLDDSLADVLEDKSDVFKKEDLDHILSVSLSQGMVSPLANPSAPHAGDQSHDLRRHAEPTSKPMAQNSFESRMASLDGVPGESEAPANPIFSDYEPTPVPEMRRRRNRRAQPKKGRSKLLVFAVLIALVAGGYGVWQFLQSKPVQLQLEVTPSDQVTVQIGMDEPVQLSTQDVFSVIDGQTLKIQHPALPTWSKGLTAQELESGVLRVNLETLAPKVPLVVRSNRVGAKVYVLGLLRGETIKTASGSARFTGQVPSNPLGKIKVRLTHPNHDPIERSATRKRKSKSFFAYIRFE
jgi:serine/threonine protein kinase